jgi:hypothetical protein
MLLVAQSKDISTAARARRDLATLRSSHPCPNPVAAASLALERSRTILKVRGGYRYQDQRRSAMPWAIIQRTIERSSRAPAEVMAASALASRMLRMLDKPMPMPFARPRQRRYRTPHTESAFRLSIRGASMFPSWSASNGQACRRGHDEFVARLANKVPRHLAVRPWRTRYEGSQAAPTCGGTLAATECAG